MTGYDLEMSLKVQFTQIRFKKSILTQVLSSYGGSFGFILSS